MKLIRQKISPDTISEGEFLCYSAQEIADAKEELDQLEKAGMLYSQEGEHTPAVYKGIVKSMCLNISQFKMRILFCRRRLVQCESGKYEFRSRKKSNRFAGGKERNEKKSRSRLFRRRTASQFRCS